MTEEEFDELRPSAFAIAYRMLGSVSEAEDVVQEGFLRLHRAREGGERIESPRAYLSTVVSRLSLDHLRSARVLREVFDEPYDRIAEIVARASRTRASSPHGHAATWRSGARASRRHASSARSSRPASFAAVEVGDLEGLEELL